MAAKHQTTSSSDSPRPRPTAVVIGAGIGGVSVSARLARAGFDVTVFEKNDFTGGRCSLLHSPSDNVSGRYRFDQGPSLLLLPDLFRRTFSELGTSLAAEGVHLVKCEPNYSVHHADGARTELSTDLAVMKTQVQALEGEAGFARYLAFLRESHRHYELSVEHVLLRNFESAKDMLRWPFLRNLLRLHPFESIWTRASEYFWTERLRRVFTFGSMYMGMSPFDAPGTYSLLQYTELAEGIWYPIGGFWKVVEALVAVGKREGVRFRMNTAVKRILLEEGRARGVELESGEKVIADVVVNNSDLVYAYNELMPERTAYAEALAERPGSCSSISFYWALDRKVEELGAHNIFLAERYRESFDDIFRRHLIPEEPSFYVNVPSRVDATAAPAGADSVVVLVPVGHLTSARSSTEAGGKAPTETQDWPAMISLARRTILATLQARIGVDLAPLIVHEQTNSPPSWKERFHLDRGAILGLSHSFFNVLCFRPSTRARKPAASDALCRRMGTAGRIVEALLDACRGSSRDIPGLYMVGASTHPGTGVPIVLAGAALVAEQICHDRGIEVPWKVAAHAAAREKKTSEIRELDRVDPPRPWWMLVVWLVAALLGFRLGEWLRSAR